jgi:chemotaxis response regulator CheB
MIVGIFDAAKPAVAAPVSRRGTTPSGIMCGTAVEDFRRASQSSVGGNMAGSESATGKPNFSQLVVGSSTGGVDALSRLFAILPNEAIRR